MSQTIDIMKARRKRNLFEETIQVDLVTGEVGSGKTVFMITQILEGLAKDYCDLIITNVDIKTELLPNPDEWKRLTTEYIEENYPLVWERPKRNEYGHTEIEVVKRSAVIARNNRQIDFFSSKIKPSQIIHIETEQVSSEFIKQLIQDKAKEMGLVDEDGRLLIRVWLVLDEAFSALESRRSGSSIVIDLSQFVLQQRHFGIRAFLVSPVISAIDVRYRELSKLVFELRKVNKEVFHICKCQMSQGRIIGKPLFSQMFGSSLAVAYQLYSSWAPPIKTLVEIQRKAKQAEEERKDTEKREYACDVCSKVIWGFTNFKAHKLTHTGDVKDAVDSEIIVLPSFICAICGRKIIGQYNYQVHLATHTDKSSKIT